MHICVSDLIIVGSDGGLSSGWRQAIVWTSAGMLLVRPLGTHFPEVLIEIVHLHSKKYGGMAAIRSRSQCVNSTFKDLLEQKFTLDKNTPLTKMHLKMSCKMSILSRSHVLITPAINSKMHTYCKALISERHFFMIAMVWVVKKYQPLYLNHFILYT